MKHIIILELLRKLKTNHPLRRKFKIFLGVGLVGSLMVGALVVWAGFATFKSVANLGSDPIVQEKILKIESEIGKLPPLAKTGCWDAVKGLMNVEAWIEKPVSNNLSSLKLACVNQ